jgi:hypothetical protein
MADPKLKQHREVIFLSETLPAQLSGYEKGTNIFLFPTVYDMILINSLDS